MQDLMTNHGRVWFRRRVAALAMASALAAAARRRRSRSRSATRTSRCAGTTRSATTSACGRSRRIRRSSAIRTSTTATATSATARSSPTGSTCCPNSTSSTRGSTACAFSCAAWYDAAYSNLDDTDTATANTLVNGLPVAGALSPYTKRYAKGVSGEWLDAFAFANFDVVDVPVNVKVGQHTVYWGDSLLLGGAIHGVSYAQNSLDVWKGFATPGAEAKELFRPRGGITLQAQPTKDLSVAGAVVLQLAGGARSRVGQLPDDQRRAQLRRRLASSSDPIRLRQRFPARRRTCASGAAHDIEPPAN